MFLLASLPDPAALTVSVSSSVSSCYCSAAELGPTVRRRLRPALPDVAALCHVCEGQRHSSAMMRGDAAAVVSVETTSPSRIEMI